MRCTECTQYARTRAACPLPLICSVKLVIGSVKNGVILPAVLKFSQSFFKKHGRWPTIDELPFQKLFGSIPALPKKCTPPFSSSDFNQYCIAQLIDYVHRIRSIVHSRPVADPAGSTRQPNLPQIVLQLVAMLEAFLLHCGVLKSWSSADAP